MFINTSSLDIKLRDAVSCTMINGLLREIVILFDYFTCTIVVSNANGSSDVCIFITYIGCTGDMSLQYLTRHCGVIPKES